MWTGRGIKEFLCNNSNGHSHSYSISLSISHSQSDDDDVFVHLTKIRVLCRTYVQCSSSFTLQVSDEDNEGLKPIVKLLSRDENKVRLK